MGGVGGRRKDGRGREGRVVVEVEIVEVESGAMRCEKGAKRGWEIVVVKFVDAGFDIRDLWPGERRRSGSGSPGAASRRRRLGEDGEMSVFCAWLLSLTCWRS